MNEYLLVGGGLTVLFILYLCFREYLIYRDSVATRQARASGILDPAKRKLDLQGMFENIDMALDELRAEYDDAIKKGAPPETLTKQKGRIDQLTWAKDNEWWLRPILPYAEKWADKLLKMFG